MKTYREHLKIANLTLDGYFNYGNVLQRYAVCNLLMGLGQRWQACGLVPKLDFCHICIPAIHG